MLCRHYWPVPLVSRAEDARGRWKSFDAHILLHAHHADTCQASTIVTTTTAPGPTQVVTSVLPAQTITQTITSTSTLPRETTTTTVVQPPSTIISTQTLPPVTITTISIQPASTITVTSTLPQVTTTTTSVLPPVTFVSTITVVCSIRTMSEMGKLTYSRQTSYLPAPYFRLSRFRPSLQQSLRSCQRPLFFLR